MVFLGFITQVHPDAMPARVGPDIRRFIYFGDTIFIGPRENMHNVTHFERFSIFPASAVVYRAENKPTGNDAAEPAGRGIYTDIKKEFQHVCH